MGTTASNSQAIQKSDPSAMRVTGSSRDAHEVTSRLQYAAKHYHLVSPATSCGIVPEGCSVAMSTVLVDADNETYDVGGKLGLAKVALDKIAAAAGISWDARLSGRLDDGSDPHYVMWRAVGQMRHLDGTIVQLLGTKEMDLRHNSAQLEALYDRFTSKHANWVKSGKKGYEPKSPDGQIREMRLHIVGHAESKARLRAIRSLGIRSAYAKEELKKPFVVAKIMWTGQSDDPELRRAFALKQADAMLGGTRALYGDAPAAAPVATPPAVLPSAAGHAQLGLRRPPPVEQTVAHDDEDAIDVPGKPASEPKTRARPAKQETPGAPDSSPPGNNTSGSGPICRFGKQKNEPLMNLSDEDLDWYRNAVSSSVNDPEKSRFKAANEAHLKEVLAEFERRNGEPPLEEGDGPDDRGDDPNAY